MRQSAEAWNLSLNTAFKLQVTVELQYLIDEVGTGLPVLDGHLYEAVRVAALDAETRRY